MSFMWSVVHATLRTLLVKCPKCGHKQVISVKQARTEVPCRNCGAALQLKKEA